MSCLRDVLENKESHMKLLRNVVCVATIVGAASFALAADTPFTGTWKLNLSKSRLVGGTVTFTPDAAGMRFTGGGDSYLLASDGSASKTSFGTAAWKKIDDHTWQETDMVKGRLDSTNTWALSADGKTLTERVRGTSRRAALSMIRLCTSAPRAAMDWQEAGRTKSTRAAPRA
jgi:hypothetical protein